MNNIKATFTLADLDSLPPNAAHTVRGIDLVSRIDKNGEIYFDIVIIDAKKADGLVHPTHKPKQSMSNKVKKKFTELEEKIFEIQKMLTPENFGKVFQFIPKKDM